MYVTKFGLYNAVQINWSDLDLIVTSTCKLYDLLGSF